MSVIAVQPYLDFGGRCDEALAFYREAIGAEVLMLMRFSQNPEPMPPGVLPAGYEDKVMHVSFRVGGSTLMASDGCGPGKSFQGISLSLAVATEADAEKAFAALGVGGTVTMPLTKTFWSPRFGMVRDRFGLDWMVTVATGAPA
jgi:PhnB protein